MSRTGINLATIIALAFLANIYLTKGTELTSAEDYNTPAQNFNTDKQDSNSGIQVSSSTTLVTTSTAPYTPQAPSATKASNTTKAINTTKALNTTIALNTTKAPNTTQVPASNTPAPSPTKSSTTIKRPLPPPKETNPGVKKIIHSMITVPINLLILYKNETYLPELDNEDSYLNDEIIHKYEHQLSQIYNHVEDFNRISINRFWSGSLGVDYNVHIIYYGPFWAGIIQQLREIDDTLKNDTNVDTLDGQQRIAALQSSVLANPCNAPDVCPLDSRCEYNSYEVICTNKCLGFVCQKGRECVINQKYEAVCKCVMDRDGICDGEKCDEKAEKLALSKENIIAIAGGTGGGVVLIFVIIIIVICAKKSSKVRPNDKVKDDASEQSFKDSEVGLHQNYKMSQVSNDVTFRGPIVAMDTRKQSDAFDMRRQSRVRISEDVENSPDYYNRGPNRSRDSIDATNLRKNSNFNLLAQRRRSSVPADLRGPTFTRNPLYNMRRKSSVYMEIDDNDSKSVMYQPSNNTDYPLRQPMTPTAGKVYDYSNLRRESTVPNAMSPRMRAGSEIWDYDDDNRMYGYKKPVPAPRRYN